MTSRPSQLLPQSRPVVVAMLGGTVAAVLAGLLGPRLVVGEPIAGVAVLLAAVIVISARCAGSLVALPGAVIASVYLVMLVFGPPIYASTWQSGGVSVILDPAIAAGLPTALLFAVGGAAICIGSALGAGSAARRRVAAHEVHVSRRVLTRALIVSGVPLVMMLLIGRELLIDRQTYLSDSLTGGMWSLAEAGSLPALAILGFVMSAGRSSQRWIAAGLLLLYVVIFFSLGSRRVALALPFALVGYLAVHEWDRRTWFLVGGTVLLTVLLLPLPIALRGLDQHGLIPYLSALFSGDLDSTTVGLKALGNNLSISYPLAAQVAFNEGTLPIGNFITSINPLPGGFTNWYEIAPTMRLNPATPYNAIGELGNYGWWALTSYMFAVGLLLGSLVRVIVHARPNWQPHLRTLLTGAAVMFAILSLQYNLRSVSRMALYALVGVVLATALSRIGPSAVQRLARAPRSS